MENSIFSKVKCVDVNCFDNVLSISNITIGEKSVLVAKSKKQSVVVCNNAMQLNEYEKCLTATSKKCDVVNFSLQIPASEQIVNKKDHYKIIKSLLDFKNNKTDVLLVLGECLLQKFPDLNEFSKTLNFAVDSRYKLQDVIVGLMNLGYTKTDYANEQGSFSVRGDIVDVFAINNEYPFRLDFFGDDLENIYSYNIENMQKIQNLTNVQVYPNTFFRFEDSFFEILKNNLSKLDHKTQIVNEYIQKAENKILGNFDDFVNVFCGFDKSILHLFDDVNIFIDEPKQIFDELIKIKSSLDISVSRYIEDNLLTLCHKNYFFEIAQLLQIKKCILFESVASSYIVPQKQISVRTAGSRNYVYDYKALLRDAIVYKKNNIDVVIFAGNANNAQKICGFFEENNITTILHTQNTAKNVFEGGSAEIVVSELHYPKSASFLQNNIVFVGTNDVVKNYKSVQKQTTTKQAFYLPKINDFVVHTLHGIGKCVGIEKLNLNGEEKDYFIIEYKNKDILYLPSEQADSINAYMGGGEKTTLNKIGGAEFAKAKEKVKNSVKQLAFDLIELYKERHNKKGFRYDSDEGLYYQFENFFPYDLTVDQAQSVMDIKNDMFGGKVMDRLICGDVGYGKTEVALRAAYIAVYNHKQVAIMCPTTILSIQHYKTAVERMADFRVNVQVLNRFKNKSQQEQILKDLKEGKIDVIIGTHRLLSQDVVFNDLSMLILDEEHRFGVGDKEKIKNLKRNIDVLTLSATPIPRTLNMAMSNIRDISIIATPPKNRLSVQCYVAEQNDALIIDACNRELARGGQVLIVFNNVEQIYDFAAHIQSIVKDAKIGIGHGQMPQKVLENAIFNLYNGEYNIFVATTIIENGIDLPLANTLIVINSDMFGLSQLYQLKGRVGRSDRLAYAYFTYNKQKALSIDAYKRLEAILEFSELGSGFKIAMRDLEIRGAGNVLGAEQHGHLQKVGYEMYCRILQEEISEVTGQKHAQLKDVKMDIVLPAYLREDYIIDNDKRIEKYTQISEIASEADLEDCIQSTKEGYGEIDFALINLMKIAFLKNLCKKQNIKRVLLNKNACVLYFYENAVISGKMLETITKNSNEFVLKNHNMPIIEVYKNNISTAEKLNFLIEFVKG